MARKYNTADYSKAGNFKMMKLAGRTLMLSLSSALGLRPFPTEFQPVQELVGNLCVCGRNPCISDLLSLRSLTAFLSFLKPVGPCFPSCSHRELRITEVDLNGAGCGCNAACPSQEGKASPYNMSVGPFKDWPL